MQKIVLKQYFMFLIGSFLKFPFIQETLLIHKNAFAENDHYFTNGMHSDKIPFSLIESETRVALFSATNCAFCISLYQEYFGCES